MSVTVTVDDPQNEAERQLSIPVFTEVLCRIVQPIAIELGLDMCDNWGTYNDVGVGETPEFFAQLDILAAAVARAHPDLREHIELRFGNVKKGMAAIVGHRPDATFCVG
ncbi:hypothetical protein [Lysobacter enzymogenes]|uniref:Uncharacterized protein n=1 Tax=Lysobacter enzymogenes TaxID=69 RepID=A0AAU9AK67_LYSEN|nr:hypothetical protein [Lysobacter enzymogenes]BAV97675.1 hypothetical protein LEN_2188 [Lysobacter enzymogenes]